MTVQTKHTIEYYYDLHPTEEDLMGYNELQGKFVEYFIPVLRWLFRIEGWFIALDMNLYVTENPKEEPLAPDVSVFKGVVRPEDPQEDLSTTTNPELETFELVKH